MTCPKCNKKHVGKIGNNQFFCWDCCVEFYFDNNIAKIFEVSDDGSLLLLKENERNNL